MANKEATARIKSNNLLEAGHALVRNGYEVVKGKLLKSFKSVLRERDVHEIYFGNIAKSLHLGIINFQPF